MKYTYFLVMNIYRARLTLPLICLFGILAISSMVLATDDLFQFWVARFNSPENLDDIAWDLEVDTAGNVYVTGTYDRGGWLDVAVLKYDSERNLLWQRFLDVHVLPLTQSFVELYIEGNVYVSCTEFDPEEPSDLYLITRKYDSMGNELWEASYGPTIQGEITDLEVDDDGNVYIAREWYGIIKYDTDGVKQWDYFLKRQIFDLEVDDAGNVYVTGSRPELSSPWSMDIFTSKFNSTGSQIWYKHYGNLDELDIGFALAVDDEENVYVAGMSWTGDNIIKYDADGTELWTANYPGSGWNGSANSIAVDEDGNVYVSGSSKINTFYDCLTVKYGPTGNTLWEARYDGPVNSEDLGVGLVLDGDANVYVTCQSKGGDPPNHDYATIMYDTDGTQLWVRRYDGTAHGEDRSQDIEVDGYGNVYVTGSSTGTGTGFDFATIKYMELTTSNAVTSLIYNIEDMDLEHGIENSLVSKLSNMLKSLGKRRENAAVNQLQGFMNQVEGLRGIKLTNEQADELIENAQGVINLIQQS